MIHTYVSPAAGAARVPEIIFFCDTQEVGGSEKVELAEAIFFI